MCLTRTRRVCEDVSRRTCQALDHFFPSLAPSLCFRTLFFFSFCSTNMGLYFQEKPKLGLIYCTVELWEGKAYTTWGGFGSRPPCWWWWFLMRPAGHDASSPGRNCDVPGSDTSSRPCDDQSLGHPPRAKRQIKLEERLSAPLPYGQCCGQPLGPVDLAPGLSIGLDFVQSSEHDT